MKLLPESSGLSWINNDPINWELLEAEITRQTPFQRKMNWVFGFLIFFSPVIWVIMAWVGSYFYP